MAHLPAPPLVADATSDSALAMLQAVIAASPLPMWVKDAQGRYVGVSPAFAELWGLHTDDFVRRHDSALLAPAAANLLAHQDAEALAQDGPVLGVLRSQRPDGEPVQLDVVRRRLQQGGRVLGLLGGPQVRDDSGASWDQRERRLLFQFSQVAHELRSPLGGVLGLVDLLTLEPDLCAHQRSWLKTIQDCGRHLLAMINDTVDMGLVCSGQVKLEPLLVEVGPLVGQLIEWVQPQLEGKPVVLAAQWQAAPGAVPGGRFAVDAKRLRQVLLNLLSNAVRHTQSGQISLLVTQGKADGTAPERLRFEVRDSGDGISAERLADIFSGGQVLSAWFTSQGGHRGGLGLLISRRLVHALGGELQVSSTPGVGTRFWFEIDAPVCGPGIIPSPSTAIRQGMAQAGLPRGSGLAPGQHRVTQGL